MVNIGCTAANMICIFWFLDNVTQQRLEASYLQVTLYLTID